MTLLMVLVTWVHGPMMTLGYEFGGVKAAEDLDEREAKDMLKRRMDCGSEVGTGKSKKILTST